MLSHVFKMLEILIVLVYSSSENENKEIHSDWLHNVFCYLMNNCAGLHHNVMQSLNDTDLEGSRVNYSNECTFFKNENVPFDLNKFTEKNVTHTVEKIFSFAFQRYASCFFSVNLFRSHGMFSFLKNVHSLE